MHCAIFFKGRILIMAVLLTEFGKSLIFHRLVLMLEVKSKRHGGAGSASISVVLPLESIIHDQVLDLQPEEFRLNSSSGKFNIVYESVEAIMDNEFLNSLKSQQSLLNSDLVACIADETHTVETWSGLR